MNPSRRFALRAAPWLSWAALLAPPAPAAAEVIHSRESALQAAFPDADRVEAIDLILTEEEAERVRRSSGVRLESRLVTAYEGRAAGRLLGWAFLDTHIERTLPETLMLVVAPDGRVSAVLLLAFHEPPEYMPAAGWFERFSGAALAPELSIGDRVDAISGATLSANAAVASVRRLLAVWQVRLAPAKADAAKGAGPP